MFHYHISHFSVPCKKYDSDRVLVDHAVHLLNEGQHRFIQHVVHFIQTTDKGVKSEE